MDFRLQSPKMVAPRNRKKRIDYSEGECEIAESRRFRRRWRNDEYHTSEGDDVKTKRYAISEGETVMIKHKNILR